MGTTRPTKRRLLSQYLAETRPERLAEADFGMLRERLAPVSDSYLRNLLRSSGIPLDPVVEGVRQDSFENLERTLCALAEIYAGARQAGDRDRAAACRRAVLTGKDHARLAARRRGASLEEKARKQEMTAWMLVWLENPAIFSQWVALRKKAGAGQHA